MFRGKVLIDGEGHSFIPIKGGNWLRPTNQCSDSEKEYIERKEGVDVPLQTTIYKQKDQEVTLEPKNHSLLGWVYKVKGSQTQIAEYWTCWNAKGQRVLAPKSKVKLSIYMGCKRL